MNNKKLIIILPFILLTLGCGSRNTETKSTEIKPVQNPRKEIISSTENDTINMVLSNGSGNITIRKQERQNVYISFNAERLKHLSGKLASEDSLANIRFSQITMPDGSADGPFGNEIHYDLPQNGRYVVSIGENMMAGDPWSGVFTVDINLKDNQ